MNINEIDDEYHYFSFLFSLTQRNAALYFSVKSSTLGLQMQLPSAGPITFSFDTFDT